MYLTFFYLKSIRLLNASTALAQCKPSLLSDPAMLRTTHTKMYSCKIETSVKKPSGFEEFMGLCNILNKPHTYFELYFIRCDLWFVVSM